MKLLTFLVPPAGPPRLGALCEDGATVLDLDLAAQLLEGRRDPRFADMLSWLRGGQSAREQAEMLREEAISQQAAEAFRPLAEVTLLAPLPRPASIRDCLGFERHLRQCSQTVARWRWRPFATLDNLLRQCGAPSLIRVPPVVLRQPIYYKGNAASVIGHGAAAPWPDFSSRLDYELEFGVFIGRPGRDITVRNAWRHIAGFTIFNDFSARDSQLEEMGGRLGPAKGKDFDCGNAMGPYLVTADELRDAGELRMAARINGETWSETSSREMLFTWSEIVSYISQQETLHPGDFIGSGTAPGGCGLELDRWIAPGDVVELEVERLGVLRNTIAPPIFRLE